MTKLESNNTMPSSKGGNNQWSQQPIHDPSLNYSSYSSGFPGTTANSQGITRTGTPTSIMTGAGATPTGVATLSPPPQGYAQHDPSSHYNSYQQSQPYSYYTHQQPPPGSYPYNNFYGNSAMTPSSSYSSPTHVHSSLSTSPSPSANQSLGTMGALLSPKSDLSGPDSHYHLGGSNGNNQQQQQYPYRHNQKDPSQSTSSAAKKNRSSISSAPTNFSNIASASSSIHAIASVNTSNARGGTTAIVAANLSPPASSVSSGSAMSPPSSVSSPTTPKKKGGSHGSTSGAGGKKNPNILVGSMEGMQSKFPKPTQSYSFLITTAILESPNKQLTLNEIYEWVMEHYPWYRTAINGWK
ncbi:Forkhead box protein J3, partial [Entomortierella lignicola]